MNGSNSVRTRNAWHFPIWRALLSFLERVESYVYRAIWWTICCRDRATADDVDDDVPF